MKASFTGSTRAGHSVAELAAKSFTRVHLELGGKNALIVMGDADLDRAVRVAARGSFFIDAVAVFGALLSIGSWGGPFWRALVRDLLEKRPPS